MYSLINQNVDQVLASIDRHLDIDVYLALVTRFPNVNVQVDEDFQRQYRKYWQLNAARLSENFCKAYFGLMESLRGDHNVNIETVGRSLYQVPTNKNGRQSLQFSFASKLVHTLDHHKPIYDSMVAAFFFFQGPESNKDLDSRLRLFLAFYNFLCREYKRVLSHGLLEFSISRFRTLYTLDETYTDEKIIDTLIWRFVTLLRNGALRDGRISYS